MANLNKGNSDSFQNWNSAQSSDKFLNGSVTEFSSLQDMYSKRMGEQTNQNFYYLPTGMTYDGNIPNRETLFNNPKNLKTSTVHACGACHEVIRENDSAILCESGCNFWFHRVCSGLTEKAYKLLTIELYAEWACNECIRSRKVPLIKFKQ